MGFVFNIIVIIISGFVVAYLMKSMNFYSGGRPGFNGCGLGSMLDLLVFVLFFFINIVVWDFISISVLTDLEFCVLCFVSFVFLVFSSSRVACLERD